MDTQESRTTEPELFASDGGTLDDLYMQGFEDPRPGYYGHGMYDLVFVSSLDCPDYETLERRKDVAGVMTVRVYR